MSIHALVWTDPTTALRDWLRGEATITAIVGERTYANGLPNDAILPAIVVQRVGGGPQLPLDVGLFQFDCWAGSGTTAASLVSALIRLIYSTPNGTSLDGTTHWGGAVEEPEILWLPDPVAGTPRYVVTVQIVTKTPNSP